MAVCLMPTSLYGITGAITLFGPGMFEDEGKNITRTAQFKLQSLQYPAPTWI